MKQEENETSEELQALQNLQEEFESHRARIQGLQKKGKLKDVLSEELGDTIMPLLEDFVVAQVNHALSMENWVANLEEDVDGGGNSALTPEEIELFSTLFLELQGIAQSMKTTEGAPPEAIKHALELEVKTTHAMKILERLSSDEEEEEDDTEEDDDSESDNDTDS